MPDEKKPFPSREEWKAPWEKNGTEFDADTAATLIYNLQRNAHNATEEHRAAVAGLQEQVTTLTTERDEAKTQAQKLEDEKITDATERANTQLRRELDEIKELLKRPAEQPPAGDAEQLTPADKALIALRAGLSEEDADRLRGSTRAELEADAKTYAERLGLGSDESLGDDDSGFGYTDRSDSGEMPMGIPSQRGFRTNLGGAGAGRGFDPAKERDALPRR